MLLYLQTHLEAATDARKANNDWRIFYLDIYSGHLSYRIWALCWERMYVFLYHGGGCTGLTQTNDLWLHLDMERLIGDLESICMMREMLLRPHKCPSFSRSDLLNMALSVWRFGIDHRKSILFTKRAGMSLAVDGSEDREDGVGI